MEYKLPIWLKDQHGYQYQVFLDANRTPYIEMRNYNHRLLSMVDVVDKPEGHVVIWGDTEFTVVKNIQRAGIGDS